MAPSDLQELIRRRAHQIWEEEGCPEGRARIHWLRAEAEFRECVWGGTDAGDRASQALHNSPAQNLSETRAEDRRRRKARSRKNGVDPGQKPPSRKG